MQVKSRSFVFLFGLVVMFGCASKDYRSFSPAKLKSNESVALGRFTIIFKGKADNKNCMVCFKGKTTECQRLTKEGIVIVALTQGENTLQGISCNDSSEHRYEIKGAKFALGTTPTYFGDVKIVWTEAGGFKTSQMFGAIGAAFDYGNDGKIVMSVEETSEEAIQQTYRDVTSLATVNFSKSLMSIGK
ncbi:MAG TPA: hypothetical protein VNJ01_17900 [Bacteriovoracaceae bacterium]|nr:hypothetical protein [Bacteriovoracaceae bacterium]